MKITKITPTGKAASYEASDRIFATTANEVLVAQAVRVYLSNQRQGTSATKTRSAVERTKAKVYRQKGTGRARHGSRNAPIFVGGGVAHGPRGVANWSLTLSKKQKQVALISALTLQCERIVVSDIPLETSGKTKYAARLLQSINAQARSYLLVLHKDSELTRRSFANIPTVVIRSVEKLNAYDIAAAETIIFTSQAIADLENRLLVGSETKKATKVVTAEKTTKKVADKPAVTKPESKAAVKATTKTEAKAVTKTAAKATKKVAEPKAKKVASTKTAKSTKAATTKTKKAVATKTKK